MARLPKTPTDVLRLADWVELRALTSDDRTASLGDLETALSRGSILEPRAPHRPYAIEAIEELGLQVFAELEQRAVAARKGYPFQVALPRLVAPPNWRKMRSSYIYCLALSYFGGDQLTADVKAQRELFEHLSVDAAKSFIGGEGIRFASPRNPSTVPKSFVDAVNKLCKQLLLEGEGFRRQSTLSGKDRALDIVAWRHAFDRMPGRLILFGNCASGGDWQSKVSELDPQSFCADWMVEIPPSQILKALFIPHRIDARYWKTHTRRAGIIFDRCRIAAILPTIPWSSQFTGGPTWAASAIRSQPTA
jgi:hypothetical protein